MNTFKFRYPRFTVVALTAAILMTSLFCVVSLAESNTSEPFELRCGIHFGDTAQDVMEKERFEPHLDYNQLYETNDYYEGELMNFEKAGIYYYFDEDTGELTSIQYLFDPSSHPGLNDGIPRFQSDSRMLQLYDSIKGAVSEKYGPSYNDTYGEESPYKGSLRRNWSDQTDVDMKEYALDEWIIETEPYNVKIELMYQHYLIDSDLGIAIGGGKAPEMYWIKLTYETFAPEDIDAQTDEKGQYDDDF